MSEKFQTEDRLSESASLPWLLRHLWRYVRTNPILLIASIIAVLVAAFLSRMTPTLIGYLVDHGILPRNQEVIGQVVLAFVIVAALRIVFDFSQTYFFLRLGARVLAQIREHLHLHLQKLPISYFDRNPSGRVVARIANDPSTLGEIFSTVLLTLVTNFVLVVFVLGSMLLISVPLTALCAGTLPVFLWLANRQTKGVQVHLRQSKKDLANVSANATESLQGLSAIEVYHTHQKHSEEFWRLGSALTASNLRLQRAYALMQPVLNLFSGWVLACALFFGAWYSGSLGLGAVIAFVMHSQDLLPPLRDLVEKWQQLQNSITSGERVFQLLEEVTETADISGPSLTPSQLQSLNSSNTKPTQDMNPAVEARALTFTYPGSTEPALTDFSFQIAQGEKLALVGRTGSGKSTLVTLLQRFYDAPPGSLFLQGSALESLSLSDLRRKVCVVQQDPFLFQSNLRENLRIANAQASDFELAAALDEVGFSGLRRTPGIKLLDFAVHEKGSNLSTGERQLIACARILLAKPTLVVLDEATANIDSVTEAALLVAMDKVLNGRTCLIVAHRISTIANCHRVLVLDQGRLVEQGSPADLMKNPKGKFAQLARAGANLISMESKAFGTASP